MITITCGGEAAGGGITGAARWTVPGVGVALAGGGVAGAVARACVAVEPWWRGGGNDSPNADMSATGLPDNGVLGPATRGARPSVADRTAAAPMQSRASASALRRTRLVAV